MMWFQFAKVDDAWQALIFMTTNIVEKVCIHFWYTNPLVLKHISTLCLELRTHCGLSSVALDVRSFRAI